MSSKLVTFVRSNESVDIDQFGHVWNTDYLASLREVPLVRAQLTRAVHHRVLPMDVRPDAPATASMWSGIGTYYFDSDETALQLVNDGALADVEARHRDILGRSTYLVCDEVLIFDKHVENAPLKMFAFFKRLPSLTRAEALSYYEVDHAAIANNKHNPIVKYLQNHVREGYTNPDAEFAYDGGPESWFRSMEEARAFFEHPKSMELASRDEERFVIRDELAHFYTDETLVYGRP